MANLFQAWDEDIQALGAAKASDDQIEARRQQLAEHFKAKAKAAGLSSKKIYETLDQFDTYSRQNSTAQDDQLTPEEQEMAQRVKDGTTRTGAIKEVGKAVKDAGIGALSSLAGWGGAIAQTAADVGENDKSELASQAAQGLYNVRDDLKSNYSEGTKLAQKDFWTPRGLAMGLAENAGQIAGSATVFGLAGKFAKAREFSRGATLLTAGTVGAPLAYSQGYGQGKESSLDEINKTSNAQLWENVKAEAKAYDDAGGTGEVPYLVKQFKEAGGDLNLMKDLMAENAGNVTGLMTVATEPLAMGVGSLMSRGAAAGGKGLRAGLVNAMNNQGMSNELARRIAAGGSAAIASQVGKIGLVQGMRGTGQEGIQEGGEGYIAKTEGSLAAGRKGELTSEDWRGEHGIIQQGLQGAAIGGIMAGGSVYSTARNASKLALEKNGLPEKHDAALVAKEQADAVLVQAANIADANPNNIDAQNAYAEAQDAALVATNDLDQLSAKFNALYTPEEQAVIKAATMEGVAARKKVADDAAKAQKELDDAQAKEQADIAAQQAEAIKTQRDAVVNNLAGMVGDDVALSNAVADLGLSEEEANSLLDDAHKVAKKQKKEAAKQPAPATATPKTPFETAVDEAFNADGTRNPKAMTSDIAKKHNIPLKPLVDAISERIDSNSAKNKAAANEALAQKRQKEKQQADVLSEKQQLENTLADFAANNDHDSMVNFLSDYEPTEADKLIKNAYASVESKKKAEQDAIAATKKAEALKAKESEAKTQAEQKKIAFNQDMANLYAANPDRNPTKAELDSVGKKHGVKSPIELAQAWVKAKNEAKAAKEAAPKLALPSPETATKDERDVSVPTGLNINRDNIENQDRRPIIVRSNGQPFQTQAAAEQALKNKSTKKPRKNKAPITPETHEVITVDGGFAIAPVVEVEKPKKPDDNEDGGVIADAPKPNAPVSPSGGTIPSQHLDRISRGLKDGKTVEEIATRIQKSLPHLTIEDVTQQVLAAQEKASKPATLDSIIGKYSDDEEVDAKIRQSGEVLKQFLPETIDDWKIDKSTFAVRGAWSVSYTKPYIVTDRKTGKEVVNSTTKSAPLDGDVLLSGDEQAIKDHIKERLTKNGITPRGVKNWQLDDAVSPAGQQAVDNTPTQSIEGEYRHSRIESAKATVTKTDKGYDVDWGDEVQSFTGKNAQDKTLSALKSENYTKQGQETAPITRDDSRSVAPIQNEIEKLSEIASEFYKKHSDIKVRGGWDNEESAQKYYEMLSKINDLKDELRVKLDKQRADSAINPPQKTAHQIMTDKANEAEARITSSTYERAKKRKEKEHDIWSSGKSRVRNSMISAEEVDSADIETIQNKKEAVVADNIAPVVEAQHIENGKAEEVTPEIIRESLAKVDDKPVNGKTMSLKEAKQWLLDQVSTAIAISPSNKLDYKADSLIEAIKGLDTPSDRVKNKDQINSAKKELESYYITFDVPNDGVFKVLNNVESLQKFKKKVEANRGFDKQSPKKVFPSVAQNSADTTIAEFLGDGEVENAYEFAKLQDKPIRFGVGNGQGREYANAYALTEPVDLGGGFKGFVGLSFDNKTGKKSWIFIEENTRLSIGLPDGTKDKAIKNAKDRLDGISADNKAKMLEQVKDLKVKQTDAELEQQWLSQIGYNPSQNDAFLRKVLSFKKGDDFTIGKNKVVRVNVNKYGMPISLTLEGVGITKGLDDKISLYGRDMSYETIDDLKQNIERIKEADGSIVEEKSKTGLVDEDKLKNLEISVNDFISANGLDPDNYDFMDFGETKEKTKYQVLINEMLGVVEKHIADAESKFANTPEQRKQKDKTLSTWRGARDAIQIIAAKHENPFFTTLAARRNIPASLKTRFQEKFANLSDTEKYMQAEEQSRLSAIHRANKVIEWVTKEKSKGNTIAEEAKPTPTQPESKSTPVASTSSSDLTDEEYIALQKAYNEFKAKTDKINATYSRDVALEIATGLVAEMPDKEDKIRQALIDAIRENQWNRFEINFPKQPIKVETDVELNRALKRLQKALEGTDYTIGGTFNGKSAKLLFSYKSGANGSRESVIIDRINGKFTSYHVDFDNMSREFLKPLMDATVKWLNGEEIPKMKLGDDVKWDYTTLLSTPRHIDNAFNEAKANAPTAAPVSKSDKLTQSYDEAKAKQQQSNPQDTDSKPKFSRKATESDSVPIYRIDNKNFDANNIKPHGLYVSIPSDVSTFDSPHKDVGDTSFAGNAFPKNPLNVESFKIQHKRGNDYPMEVSAGVSALKQLVSVQLFERLIKADKAELTATIKEQFPDIDTSQYYDAYELLEVLGAQLAIQDGYDAIIQKNGNDPFNEMVILDNSIIESMSPTDKPKNSKGTSEGLTTPQDTDSKPKFSRGEGSGLTITQTRAILVKHFGEKLIKALESSGLLKILETMGDIPSQALKSIQAWHGSPHKFNSFSLAHLGSGEGNQAYGWGLYFAASKEVAEWYRTVLSEQQGKHRTHVTYDGIAYEFSEGSEHEAQALIRALVSKGHTFRDSLEALMELRKYPRLVEARKAFTRIVDGDSTRYTEAEIAKEDKFTKEVILKPRRILKILNEMSIDEGQLYKVDIDVIEDGLLLWDVSFEEQPKVVQQALLALGYKPKAKTKYLSLEEDGGSIYRDLAGTLGGQKEASLALKKNGVDGIKYLDGGSRQAGEGNYNYVIFDDAAVDIVETFYSENPNGIEGYYHNGQATLIADNLTPETVVATFVHELGGHKGFQELMTPTAYDSLMRQFNRLVKQGNAIALAAKARAEAAESTLGEQQDEYLPYLLTQQTTLNAGRIQQSSVAKVIEQVYRAVKAWLYRTLSAKGYDGLASKLLQPKDITLLAERMIREMGNGTNPSNNTKAKVSQFSQLNTPQTQINAVRKKYEGTSQWMKAPNGQPTKLNEMQWLQVRTPNFKAFFGDWENDPKNASQVVDSNGEPLVVYHSTKTDSPILYAGGVKEKGTPLKGTKGADMAGVIGINSGAGIWFSDNSVSAESNSATGMGSPYGHKNVIPAFINMKNPLSITSHERRNYLKDNIPISKLSFPSVSQTIYDENLKRNVKRTNYSLDFPYRFDWQQRDIIRNNGFDGIYMKIPNEDTEIIAFEPTQIKSAIGNTGEFNQTNPDIRFSRTEQNPRSATLDNFIAKAIAEKAWLTTEQINLLNSATTFDELIPLLDKVWNQYFEAKKLKNNNSTKTAVGVDNIKSLIRSEVDSGHITKEHGDLALYFAEKNPALFDSLKSFSFQNDAETLSGNAVGGVYNVVDKVIRISRRTNGSQLTIAHEVLHHAEEFLPENIKSSIIKAWQNDLIRAFKSAENGSNRKTMLHAIIHSIAMGDMSAIEKAIDSMDGVIPANTYHLFNPSEYWAENASRLMNNRSKRQDTWIENARSWINGLIQTLKNALGLQNDAAILKGLRMVLSGSQLKEGGKGIDIDHVYNMKMLNLFSYIGKFNPDGANKTKTSNEKYSRQSKNPIAEGIKSAANDAENSLPTPIAKSIDNFMAGRRLPSSDMANITAKTELGIYKRTIGTQLNTALQNADFKKVYDMAQRYLQHVAVDAYAALKVAPNLLGKLESWSDLKKDVKKIWPANFIKQKADRAAVASIIFDETLSNKLLSDADILKALTREQRKIYKEARDAIQVSLENTAKSEMVRKLLAAEAINWSTVESLINQDLPVEQFAQTVRDMVESRIGGFKNELEAVLDADPKIKDALKTGHDKKLTPAQKATLKKAQTLKAQIETTEEALKSLNDVENRLGTLIEQGYAPLMRFGEYTLTVRDLDGKVKSFFMFESKAEQVRATNAIVARYGKTVNLETDMISKEEFKQFAGMTPETMALFAKETGMDKDEAYQHYLKLAIPARSAMTRMIKRNGTEGFSDDIQRVVASFVMSNARMSAKNIYAAQIEKSIQDIESGKSVKDQAIVMKENVFNPKENSAQLRNFLFLWNLGGSIFFGLLNMTQPYMQTLPHLSQYVPIGDATRAILRGSKIAGSAMKNGTAPKGYEAEYNRAVREGVVDPQNVFMLSGVERGKTGASNSAWGVITHTMGLIAQVTESFNRKAVFIAALEVANKKGAVWLKKKGFNSAYDFAKDTVDQTQGVYDKANRSNWANTSVGAPLMVFKQFSINYVEQMVRMWKKEAASGDEGKKAVFLMLAMLASLSGMMGLPFIKDILDVSETTAAFLGNPVNIEREARLALGKDLADPLFNGVLNHFVFNNLSMDIQSRTGMPDLVPWSNALNPTLSAQGRINEFASIAGATGGLIEKGYDATQLIARGNIGTAALTLMPRSITSAFTGGKMAVTDEVMDSKGNKLFDTTWDEGLVKFIDANPKRMADLSRTRGLEGKDKAIQAYMTTNFRQKIINAMMDDDKAEVNELMAKVKAWNESRPRYPVFINLNTLSENANKKEQTFDARESIPKGMNWMKNERPEM